jgi:flagellar biosynthetic protein FlhB
MASSGEEESSDKSHEPTPRKLEEARKKGEIARAADLLSAAGYLGMLVGAAVFGPAAVAGFGDAVLPLVEQPDRLLPMFFGDGASAPAGGLIRASLAPLGVFFAIPVALVLATLLATRTMLFTPSKLTFKASRISPIANAKNKFGRSGLFEFFKSFLKLALYSLCLALFLWARMEEIIGAVYASPSAVAVIMARLMVHMLALVVVIALVIGGLDYLWQYFEHIRKNRMSQKEVRDEFKESEGDPMLKQQRRTRAQELALNQMLQDVPDADVVIVNPTHYAVALTWSRMPGAAPVCVAKGQDAIALRIREIATAHAVPIHSDPPTARALYATTEMGAEISTAHFRPVAAAIRFADDMRRKMRSKP